jgi:hypothetical protein
MVILGENLCRTNHQTVEEDCGIKTEQMKCSRGKYPLGIKCLELKACCALEERWI